ITEKPKYGQTLVAEVKTQNMFNEKLKLQVWERDTISDTGHDAEDSTLLWEKEITVNLDGINYESIVLTDLMMKKAQGNGFSYLLEGGEHEYYIAVRRNNHTTYSRQTVQVLNVEGLDTDSLNEDEGQSPAMVGEPVEVSSGEDCGQRYCIKIGDKSELIREINIRLAGFGGNVPTDEFTDRTE